MADTDPDFAEYNLFRIDLTLGTELGDRRGPFPWLLALGLAAWTFTASRRTSGRRRSWLRAAALLPLALATFEPAGPRAASPRDCGQGGCMRLSTILDRAETVYIDTTVVPGRTYDYILRIVTNCGSHADSAVVTIAVPVPTPTPRPTSTNTPAPQTPQPTYTPIELPPITVAGTDVAGSLRRVEDLLRGDRVSISSTSGQVNFNGDGACTDESLYRVNADGLPRNVYANGNDTALCYSVDLTCQDPLNHDPHAGLYMRFNGADTFVGSQHTFSAAAPGALFLGVNDCTARSPAPNSGSFKVQVNILRRR